MLTVLTVATAWQPSLGRFAESARRVGIEPLMLGYGQPWRGFGWRLKLVRQALECLSGLVLFTDSYDVLLARGPMALLEATAAIGHPLIFGAERNCWPRSEWAERHPPAPTAFRYLNAGGWIGAAEYVRGLLDRNGIASLADDADDQAWWQELWFREPDALALDYHQRLFGLLWSCEASYEPDDRGFRNMETDTYPCLLHGNGNADLSRAQAWLRLR